MSKYEIAYIDSHTAGEPLRLLIGGPRLKGNTLYEKQKYMQENYDFIRTSSMLEPRGHADMFGAVMTDPVDPSADLGVLFINGGGYDNMCGHGAIAVGAIATNVGLVEAVEPMTEVLIETISGIVSVYVEVEKGKAVSAELHGSPSFLYKPDVEMDIFGKKLRFDIAFGGNFFAIVPIERLGLSHSVKQLPQFIEYGQEIRDRVNAEIKIQHPIYEYINWVNDILFTGEPGFDGDTHKSLVFLGTAQIDRSPCGTGTSARMAMLYAKGKLTRGQKFLHESILGTVFEGEVGDKATVGDFPAIIPIIKSNAYITGSGTLVLDSDDPCRDGFLLR